MNQQNRIPRTPSSPDAMARARALLGAAGRKQQIYAHAAMQAEAADGLKPQQADALAEAMGPQANADLVGQLTQTVDEGLLHTSAQLLATRQHATRLLANDAEYAEWMAAAYGPAPQGAPQPGTVAPPATESDVIDVQAREVKLATDPGNAEPS